MRYIYLLLSLLFYLPAICQVQTAPEPAWITGISFKQTHDFNEKEDFSGGYYYLLSNSQTNLATKEVFKQFTCKITNNSGVQNASDISVEFNPSYQTLTFHRIDIIRDGIRVSRLDKKNIRILQRERELEAFIYTGKKTANYNLHDVREGDIIDYSYTLRGFNPVHQNKYTEIISTRYNEPLVKLFVKVLVPEHRKLHIDYHIHEHPPIVSTKGKLTEYSWKLENKDKLKIDENLPYWYDPYPKIFITEFNGWNDLENWSAKLFGFSGSLSTELTFYIKEIKEKHEGTRQLEAALRFVQDEVRYLGFMEGISAYKPKNPNEVFRNRFGDCKDKSLLLVSILRQLGYDAYPAFVNSYYNKAIEHWQPSPYMFDHCIVKVVVNGESYWYDPTISYQRGSFDGIYIPDYGKAMVIGDGIGLQSIRGNNLSKILVEENFIFNKLFGKVSLNVITTCRGQEADNIRSYFNSNRVGEIQDSYLFYYQSIYSDVEVSRKMELEDDEENNILIIREYYEIDSIWNRDVPGWDINIYFPAQFISTRLPKPDRKKRNKPYSLGFPVNIEQVIKVKLPEDWNVDYYNYEVKNDYLSYLLQVDYSWHNKEIMMKYNFQTLKNHVDAEDYISFVNDLEAINENIGYYIYMGNNESGQLNFLMIFLATVFLGLFIYIAFKLYHYDPIAPVIYSSQQSIGSWLLLVAIGLIITPFRILYVIFTSNYFDAQTWNDISGSSSASYNPAFALLFTGELIFNLFMFVFILLLIVLFFSRRSSLPKLIIIYYVVNFTFILGEYLIMDFIELPAGIERQDVLKEIFKSFFALVIWVPYFSISYRVEKTFQTTLRKKEPEKQKVLGNEVQGELIHSMDSAR